MLKIIFVGFLIMATTISNAQIKRINVDELGAKPNDRSFNSAQPIWEKVKQHQLSGEAVEFKFGPGTYYFDKTESTVATLWIKKLKGKGAKNMHFIGVKNKTKIIVMDPQIGCIRFDGAENCSIQNLIIDHDIPPFTQGEVVKVDKGAGTFNLKVDKGYPAPNESWFSDREWGILWNKDLKEPKSTNFDHTYVTKVKDQGNNTYTLKLQSPWHLKRFALKDWFILTARQNSHCIFAFWNCKKILVKDVIVHSSPNITCGVVMCEGMHFDGFQVRLKPNSDRLHTSNGDGIHFHGNRNGPIIENCFFEGILDDGINLNVHQSTINTISTDGTINIKTGPSAYKEKDMLQVFHPESGKILGTVQVKSIVKHKNGIADITLEKPLNKLTTKHVFYNLNASCKNYIIRNNRFQKHRRFGLLIRTGYGLIENNTFYRSYGTGIVIGNEAFLEGPLGQDIIVRNNTFTEVGRTWASGGGDDGGAISIVSKKLGHQNSGFQNFKNIQLINNTIISPPRYGVLINGAKNVFIKDTVVKKGIKNTIYKESMGIKLKNCSEIKIDGFTHEDDSPRVTGSIFIDTGVPSGNKGVSISGHNAKLNENAKKIVKVNKSR